MNTPEKYFKIKWNFRTHSICESNLKPKELRTCMNVRLNRYARLHCRFRVGETDFAHTSMCVFHCRRCRRRRCLLHVFHSSIESVCEYCVAARARHSSVYITYEIYSHYHMGTGIPNVAAIRYAKKNTQRERECFRTIRIRWCECFMCWLEFQWFWYCITNKKTYIKKVLLCVSVQHKQ